MQNGREASSRFADMERHLPVRDEQAAVVVAADLLREHRPGMVAPTYLYALETPDDD